MKITIQCPNCFEQVSRENRYCTFCGYDLTSAGPSGEGGKSDPPGPGPAPEPPPYDGPRYCPNGDEVENPSIGFCPVCGAPLVYEPPVIPPVDKKEPEIPPDKPAPDFERICSICGYVCTDPKLKFCIMCANPFEPVSTGGGKEKPPEKPEWVCFCGVRNSPGMDYCKECGKPKGWKPEKEPPVPPAPEPVVPNGMKPPTSFDLEPKATYDP